MGRDFKIHISDPADLESQIINQVQINFWNELNFVLLYNRSNTPKQNLYQQGYLQYKLAVSTIGQRDSSFMELITSLLALFNEKDADGIDFRKFGDWLLVKEDFYRSKLKHEHFFMSFENINSKLEIPQTGRVKVFDFNKLAIADIRDGESILVMGFGTDEANDILEGHLTHFIAELNNNCKFSVDKAREVAAALHKLNIDNYNACLQIVESFKRTNEQDLQSNIYLFTYNAHDNRLYYTYIDRTILDEAGINDYFESGATDDGLKLSPNQIGYVKENLHVKFRGEPELFEASMAILDNIHEMSWLRTYLNEATTEQQWLLAQVISAIPQEPWTGVAGYTALTRVMDLKRGKKEMRWEPDNLNRGYFYSKLMLYERLLGVGGQKGNMIAFPIMDYGQVLGVIFANLKGTKDYSLDFLQNLLNLTHALKNFLTSKRQTEFLEDSLNDLIKSDKRAVNPIPPIVRNIPKLFNTPLVVVWDAEEAGRSGRPLCLFGFGKYEDLKGMPEDHGLLPMRFTEIDKDDELFELLDIKSFDYVAKLQEEQIISDMDIPHTLSKKFLQEYVKRTIDAHPEDTKKADEFTLLKSIAYGIRSAFVYRYTINHVKGYIVVYLTQDPVEMERHLELLKLKMSYVSLIIKLTDPLSDFSTRDTDTHELRSINDMINVSLDMAEDLLKEVLTKSTTLTEEESKRLKKARVNVGKANQMNLWFKQIVDTLDNWTLDTRDMQASECDLISLLSDVWEWLAADWESAAPDSARNLYSRYAGCRLIIEVDGRADTYELGGDSSPDPSAALRLFAPISILQLLFFNLFRNAYKGQVISQSIMASDPGRAVTEIRISSHNEDHFRVRFSDSGAGMSPEMNEWVNDIIEHVRSKPTSPYIPTGLRARYRGLEKSGSRSSGFGIFRIARSILSILAVNGLAGDQGYFTVRSKKEEGTTMSFILPRPNNIQSWKN